jgi:hypothetical protein
MLSPLLRNPVYIGRFEASGDQCHWEPLVPDEIWLATQRALDARKVAPRSQPGRFPLSGFVICPQCGSIMSGETLKVTPASKRKNPGRGYRCVASRHSSALKCSARAVATQVEEQTFDAIGTLFDGLQDKGVQLQLRRKWARLTASDSPESKNTESRIRTLEQAIEKSERRMSSATGLLADGAITKTAYDHMMVDEIRANDARQAELVSLCAKPAAPAPPSLDAVLASAGSWSQLLTAEGQDVTALRDLLGLLVQRIVPERVAWGRYQTHIDWTPLGEALRTATGWHADTAA